jgi:regulator of sirC expression with transglutaminase-like and TPR domain
MIDATTDLPDPARAAPRLDPALADRLAAVGRLEDADIPLGRVALALAGITRPGVALDRYEAHLDQLGDALHRARSGLGEVLDADTAARLLGEVLHEEFGYDGDRETYDDLQNANLMRVIDRRRGLPVALAILYAETARMQGWALHGLNFPGHFLVRLDLGGDRRVLDPFNGGRTVDAPGMRRLLTAVEGPDADLKPEHYAPIGNRDILLRLQNNLKLRHIRAGALDAALTMLDAMVLLAPTMAWQWRERGVVHHRLGHPGAAIADLERFVALAPASGVAARWQTEAAQLIAEIRRSLN